MGLYRSTISRTLTEQFLKAHQKPWRELSCRHRPQKTVDNPPSQRKSKRLVSQGINVLNPLSNIGLTYISLAWRNSSTKGTCCSLEEDLGLVPRTHMMAHNQVLGGSDALWLPTTPGTNVFTYIYTYIQNLHYLNKSLKINNKQTQASLSC